jgi:hypothetical protein
MLDQDKFYLEGFAQNVTIQTKSENVWREKYE